MRGYGIPQVCFALESHIDDIALKLNIDPIKFREDNFINLGYIDPLNNIKVRSFGLISCIEKGKKLDEILNDYELKKLIKRFKLKMSLELEKSIVLANRMAIYEILYNDGNMVFNELNMIYNYTIEEIKEVVNKVLKNPVVEVLL